ncbi:glycolate oxidase subunit GlcD-like [Ylistrum balloti]|uniref:glycolate oxidase subunit GlcD-like n=1 Tax=Ylistrum balloti TaxID=509963 RepID=UPI002905DF32|nr:glycolate oxidase subunit GlcD-like [Ylistrum balloti]
MTQFITDTDILASYKTDASGLFGSPDAIARPRDYQDLKEIVLTCLQSQTAITPIGGLSSTTGAPLAPYGLALDCTQLTGIIDLDIASDSKSATALIYPGTNLQTLKTTLETEGWYYPPDPTSASSCTLGGTVSTNASGPGSYQYGSTHRWVEAIHMLDGAGQEQHWQRNQVEKITLGYRFLANPLDLIIGSEGTLGVFTRIQIRLIRPPEQRTGILTFFSSLSDLLVFLQAACQQERYPAYCLEGFDAPALSLVTTSLTSTPPTDSLAIYLEIEHTGDVTTDKILSHWLPLLEANALVEHTSIFQSPQDFRDIYNWRQIIPSLMNTQGKIATASGGKKHSTDWCVPLNQLQNMFTFVDQILTDADLLDLPHIRYGHFGNGHPHHNFITRNPDEDKRLTKLLPQLYQQAINLGGTFVAEHGVGKLKAPYLKKLLDKKLFEAGRNIKQIFDPQGLMAPGNIWGDSKELFT